MFVSKNETIKFKYIDIYQYVNMKYMLKVLKALSDETRLKIVKFLLDGEKCVCKIFPYVKRTQSTVSIQLGKLESWGILESRRVGKYIHYKIKDKKVYGLCKLLGIKKAESKKIKCRRR